MHKAFTPGSKLLSTAKPVRKVGVANCRAFGAPKNTIKTVRTSSLQINTKHFPVALFFLLSGDFNIFEKNTT
ncbi:hypothetical protein L596_017301 [Steinernema carpocapsae]|uniref:Uncharacterized protein n=1 Tax=Steinernema carpocapsae TaxID=34508 RepID=A0A4U5N184_STECR|nr:hypothetical protein L596_017301 [Steinernema carpocapsae]